jgi:hypothetical protein
MEAARKRDCWEALSCGRKESCPAYSTKHGRNCFAVTGTYCRGIEQGSYEEKIGECRAECKFYQILMNGEP